jgi:hydrogenase expression/formation protein HypC
LKQEVLLRSGTMRLPLPPACTSRRPGRSNAVCAVEIKDAYRTMCLAVPARIVELQEDRAVVDAMGNRWRAKTTLLPDAKLGDVVLVHAGFAIATVDEEEAKKTWELFAEIENFEKTSNRISG